MAFYRLESVRRIISNSGSKNKRAYRFYHSSYESMLLELNAQLNANAKVTVKSISESEFVKATNNIY